MKLKRKILNPNFSSFFLFEFKYSKILDNIYYNTQFFNKFVACVFFTCFCLVAGFFKKEFWALGISNIVLLLFLFLKTKKISEGILIQRRVPKFSRERTNIQIDYVCSNTTGFNVKSFSFYEKCDAVQSGGYHVQIEKDLKSQTQMNFSKRI